MNIFQINRSDIEGRFDPKYILYLQNIHGFKYDIFPLKRFLIEKPQYGTAEIGIPRIKEQQPRYIRITDINDFGELDDSLGATAENCSDEYFLYENDLLFARSGATVGKTYLHKHLSYPAFFAGYMIRVRLDESTLLPDYLFAYTQTSFYKNWVDAIQRAAAQPNINAEEYASLPIPLPPLSVQQTIVDLYTDAQNQRKRKLEESKKLLESVDAYLLSELRIKLPKKDNSLSKRIFTTKFKEVSDGRLDPKFYRYDYNDLIIAIKKSDNCKLKNIVSFSNEIWNQESDFADVFPYLEISEINLDYGEIDSISLLNKKDAPSRARMILRTGDIAVSLTRPMRGAITIVDNREYEFLIGSTGFAIIRGIDEARISKNYLHAVLKSPIVLNQFDQRSSGGNYPAITQNDLGEVSIPLPPIQKQREIVKHIQQIRNQSKQLKNEADMILQEVKKRVERMILGEE